MNRLSKSTTMNRATRLQFGHGPVSEHIGIKRIRMMGYSPEKPRSVTAAVRAMKSGVCDRLQASASASSASKNAPPFSFTATGNSEYPAAMDA
jgi:hypothetical protein